MKSKNFESKFLDKKKTHNGDNDLTSVLIHPLNCKYKRCNQPNLK